MKNVMVRAWEIYKTLEGDHIAKLAMALRMAWAEIKDFDIKSWTRRKAVCGGVKLIGDDKIGCYFTPGEREKMEKIVILRKSEIISELKLIASENQERELKINAVKKQYENEFNQIEKYMGKKRANRAAEEIAILGYSAFAVFANVRIDYNNYYNGYRI